MEGCLLLLLLLRIRARNIYISNSSLGIQRVPEVAWKNLRPHLSVNSVPAFPNLVSKLFYDTIEVTKTKKIAGSFTDRQNGKKAKNRCIKFEVFPEVA